ncbi:hypothetical protein E0Z10_g1771 [Xylaria hypoxylon]|uniref:Dihydroorotate dehydrogenase (fumarate) n=1 Tax=Xylaria hypoxylon TaxID=37992 RepID=A0A4Z0YSJ5_9PEZI|nr:hypothetical protein E0Z10_g1771 [Xylaria hypoxylon]
MDDGGDSLPPRLRIEPPLFNSANPWATTLEHLRDLYRCPYTGAVTTRTALLDQGFPHDESVHRFKFFEAGTHRVVSGTGGEDGVGAGDASLNTLGYSPIPLDGYLGFIRKIDEEEGKDVGGKGRGIKERKPFIVSVTGSPDEVAECYRRIVRCAGDVRMVLAMEVNLSCPNIPGKPPPAYEGEALRTYLRSVEEVVREMNGSSVPWGLKTPPYTHAGQFGMFIEALRDCAVPLRNGDGAVVPVGFVTATNTLGSCLLLESAGEGGLAPALGVGGVAGAPLHPLALGNVATLRRMLDAAPETRHVAVLGIGGVADAAGYTRMRSVGAAAVGVGTALGIKGLGVFEEIEDGLGGVWEV